MANLEMSKVGTFELPTLPGVQDPPQFKNARQTFNYSVGPIAYDPNQNLLYIRGHSKFNDIAVVSIPSGYGGVANVQKWIDPTAGALDTFNSEYHMQNQASQGIFHRGFCFYKNALVGFVQPFYNVTNEWLKSFWWSDFLDGDYNKGGFEGFEKTSLPSMMVAGFIGELPSKLRTQDNPLFCLESIPQGLTYSNNGPACYSMRLVAPFPYPSNGGDPISVSPLFETLLPNSYPEWWGDRQITGAFFTSTHFVCGYRKSFGARWYGNSSFGRLYGESSLISNHSIATQLRDPGFLAEDPCGNTYQGYHAEQFASFLLTAPIDSVAAGKPIWTEIDLRPFGLSGIWGYTSWTCDLATGMIFGLERQADGMKPLVHVFSTTPDTDLTLQIQLDDLQQRYNNLEIQYNALNDKVQQSLVDLKTILARF